MNCRVAAREGGLGRALTFYEPAAQVLLYARCCAGDKDENGWVFEELLENGGETAKCIDEKG